MRRNRRTARAQYCKHIGSAPTHFWSARCVRCRRVAAGAAAARVAGGRFGAGFRSEATELLEMYDPKIGSWVSLAPMPTPRSGVNGIAVRGCFHVWGGEGEWNNAPPRVFPEHEVYDPRTNS